MSNPKTPLPLLDYSVVRDLFYYDGGTGVLFWKPKPLRQGKERIDRMRNTRRANKPVGWDSGESLRVEINGRGYQVHRVIWVLFHGYDPGDLQIDHVNGDPKDNRIANIRLSDQGQNCRNRKMHSNNRTGVKGIWKRSNGTFSASIMVNYKAIHLGTYRELADAVARRKAAEQKYHGEFARE